MAGVWRTLPETAPVGQVEYVSTGLDTLVIGNFNNLSPVPALWSPASTTDHDYIQAISSAEPATPFVNYYFEDTQHPAMTQEAAPYWCAGDSGSSLKNVMFVRLTQAFTDPALRNTEHHSFAELANAVRSSAEYSDLPTDVDWAGLKNAITYTDPDIGVIQPYVIISRLASLCYEEVQPMLSTCPAPIACCCLKVATNFRKRRVWRAAATSWAKIATTTALMRPKRTRVRAAPKATA